MKKYAIILFLSLFIVGCGASTEDLVMVSKHVTNVDAELKSYKDQTDKKLTNISKDNESIKKQAADLSLSISSNEEKIKSLMGKVEALEFQLKTYYTETKSEINALKKPGSAPSVFSQPVNANYESKYKEAFDLFQKKMYQDAIKKFSEFIASYTGTPLIPNAYYWLGECYMSIKDYEMAILNFNEVINKYPKSEKAPRALLSQADAFINLNDKESAIVVLKKVKELYPKSEEAIIAERKLKRY